eukprot:TRINITY_DN6652_c0_g1_i1.p1 TRINITY_DN6652_c0_g1~~TRINITY_DN6652_c0_g1_i1.p1  ORF type:complete len:735 (+),score=190.23 TRINITY_DN6652_c0_g1_i1:151-2355(+)
MEGLKTSGGNGSFGELSFISVASTAAVQNSSWKAKEQDITYDCGTIGEVNLSGLIVAMKDRTSGVPVKNRKYHFRTYRKCFVGREAVDWLCKHLKTISRTEAVAIGANMLKLKFFQHVVDEQKPFLDDYFFYYFVESDKNDITEFSDFAAMTLNNDASNLVIQKREDLITLLKQKNGGVQRETRSYHWRSYPDAFVASELIDWFMAKLPLRGRGEGVELANDLRKHKFIRHVSDPNKIFQDGSYYWIFIEEPDPNDESAPVHTRARALSGPDKKELLINRQSSPEVSNNISNNSSPISNHNSSPEITSETFSSNSSTPNSNNSNSSSSTSSPIPSFSTTSFRKRSGTENSSLSMASSSFTVTPSSSSTSQASFNQSTSYSNSTIASSTVTLSDFSILKVLGIGAFGKVYLVRTISPPFKIYAMKSILKKNATQSAKSERNLISERNILCNSHPFLVHLHYSFQNSSHFFLVMDYVSGGDVFFHLRRLHRFTESIARVFAAELVLALGFLHKYGIVYRDLKPENVLIDKDGHVCLTDFGISKSIEEGKTKTLCGTPSYLAPEIITGKEYDEKCDWWSLGVLILEMTTGVNPFRSKNVHQTMKWILTKKIEFPNFLKEKTIDLISKLVVRDVEKRLGSGPAGMREIQTHGFFKGVDWEDLMLKKVKSPLKLSVVGEMDTSNFSSDFTKMSFEEDFKSERSGGGKVRKGGSGGVAGDEEYEGWNIVPTVQIGRGDKV